MNDNKQLETLLAKDDIRELALLYARGVDRKDGALLRTLYTEDATDTHGDVFDGNATEYVEFLEKSFPYIRYSGHHICNHLISIDGNKGEGEVYAIAYHVIPDRNGGWLEDVMCVRYLDHYRKEQDGRWRFAKRIVVFDHRSQHPISVTDTDTPPDADASLSALQHRLFARGERA